MLKKHVATSYTYEVRGHSFPVPFEFCAGSEMLIIADDGLTAKLGVLSQDDQPADPFEEWDEGTFYQFGRDYIHYQARDAQTLLDAIKQNPGRVFAVHSQHDWNPSFSLCSDSPLRHRDALKIDDFGGYYIAPDDCADPASYAKGALETYSAFCGGEVYGVAVWEYSRPSTLAPWELDETSRDSECWGFYGTRYAEEELASMMKG